MISVQEAIQLISENTALLPAIKMPLQKAFGLVLAEDVFAQVSVPNFPQSSMDGYAFRYSDLLGSNEFTVVGEVAAGDKSHFNLRPQQAIRIFTGAPVPEGLNTVVMQERTMISGDTLIIKDEELEAENHVRKTGAEIEKGSLALQKGTVIIPAAIGFLAGIGVVEVAAYPKPEIYIIVTGKELQKQGNPLEYGQVYESNSILLKAAFNQLHIYNIQVTSTGDDMEEISAAVSTALQKADLILITGGVSVGNYDYVVQAAESCGVRPLFHNVAQRPGKPLYAGKKDEKLVFGLPGNPASVLSCFYNYVIVAIERLTGRKALLERKKLPLLAPFSKKISLRQFLKGAYTDEGVMPLAAQESFRLSSLSVANCLIVLPEEMQDYSKGDKVEVLLLPYL